MRKLVLSALTAITLTSGAFAQAVLPTVVGVKFAGPGLDDGNSPITIILDTMSMPCHEGGALLTTAALHGSIAVPHTPDTDQSLPGFNPYTLAWSGGETVNWDATSADGNDAFFTYDGLTNTFSKTITPRTYFNAVPAGNIAGLAFVVNGAGDIFDANPWAHSLRASNSGGAKDNGNVKVCYDIIVPFPIPASLRVTATKQSNTVHNLSMQNMPNPFKGQTTIRYTVANGSDVSMKVYDVLGKEVSTLVNGFKAPGSYSVSFDGSSVTPGIYFYTTVIGGMVDTKRMVVAE